MRVGHLIIYGAMIVGLVGATNFTQCLLEVRNGTFGLEGALDNHGRPVSNASDANAISYKLCLSACGNGQSPFSWSIFSQRTAAWLLPWLALVSQLPYGSEDHLDNVQSMLLCVGSPALAAYSLGLTTLNKRWIVRRFLPMHEYPQAHTIVHVLSRLQQAPLYIADRAHLLPLLFRDENKRWWQEIRMWMGLTHSWSVSTVASIGWVLVAYLFTVLDAFTTQVRAGSNGLPVGAVWLWLLPIVVGWLQISPECNSRHLESAFDSANQLVSDAGGSHQESRYEPAVGPISLIPRPSSLRRDDTRSPPIFNYSRAFLWAEIVEVVAESLATSAPTLSRGRQESLDMETLNRNIVNWSLHVWERMVIAGCFALWLQWGTTSGAIIAVWFSPTIGLGCRSAAYLAYGGLSTLSWFLIVLSGILAHYAPSFPPRLSGWRAPVVRHLSIFLRRLGKIVACLNAIGIIAVCVFQFSSLFSNCYCDSSVFWWGKERAYDVLDAQNDDIILMKRAWIGAELLAGSSAIGFLLFVNLFSNPSFPRSELKD